MSTSTAIADLLLRSSSLVSRPSTLLRTVSLSNGEAYLANKGEALTLSVLRSPRTPRRVGDVGIVGEVGFTLHEIHLTRTGFQAISRQTVMNYTD
jgi:hypothetical protein